MRYTGERLGKVLTREQLIKVDRLLSCSTGKYQRVSALLEYFRRPDVSVTIKESGWEPRVLAHIIMHNYDRQRDPKEG